MASDKQIALDQVGGDPKYDNAEVDTEFARQGGQTDYSRLQAEPWDAVERLKDRKFETRFIDLNLNPVPIAVQEDRSLVVYGYGREQYNVAATAGGIIAAGNQELDVVEKNWLWLPHRVSIFGTAAGFVRLHDGPVSDGSNCFAVQAGIAVILGGTQSVEGIVLQPGAPICISGVGIDASANLAIGIWYRKAKWVWSPPQFIQEDSLRTDIREG